MPSGLKQPIGQKRLTNIAVVRYKKGGKWFEIACYKNKVLNWRSGIEKDLDEVLQTTAVFKNVGKGVLAKEKDLEQVFKTADEREVCLEILSKGELQVSEKERRLGYENLFKDVAAVIASSCVDPNTNRPYTITMIERALRDVHFNVDPKKGAKQQAFGEALHLLQERFSIQRANMRLKLLVPVNSKAALLSELEKLSVSVESKDADQGQFAAVCLIDPGTYRKLHALIQDVGEGAGRMELLNLAVQREEGGGSLADQSRPAHPVSSVQAAGVTPPSQEPVQQQTQPTNANPTTSGRTRSTPQDASSGTVMYARGPISGIPEDFRRREMFLEIDNLQEGWQVELTTRGESEVVDACFFSPSGDRVGQFAKARRLALAASKAEAN